MNRIIILMFLLSSFLCRSQVKVDSTYITPYNYKVAVKAYFAKNYVLVDQKLNTGGKRTLEPNNPQGIGLGISIKNTIIDIKYAHGFDFLRDKKYGDTKAFDMQLHWYGRKYVVDLFIQNYKGFYVQEEDRKKEIELYPDLKVIHYGVHGLYVFNNKKFSYKAAFLQNEKQLKSAGTALIGGGVYKTTIKADSTFFNINRDKFENLQFGVSGGYAYTRALGKYWHISASLTAGVNVGNERLSNFGKKKLEVYPTLFPRASVGYNREKWALGLSYLGNFLFPSLSNDFRVNLNSGIAQFSFIKRFSPIST